MGADATDITESFYESTHDPVILEPAESTMPWDLVIYKATSLAEVDL